MRFRAIPGPVPGMLSVEGEIDVAVAEEFGRAMAAAAAQGPLVMDLSGVTFMDSSGLHALLRAIEATNGKPLVVTRPGPAVRRLFELTVPNGVPGLEIREAM